MHLNDTILALSSPTGSGGETVGIRAILRLSGPDAWPLAHALIPSPAEIGWHDSTLTLPALHLPAHVLLFRGPRSFTGEDVAELHIPHSPALIAMVTDALLRLATHRGIPARLAGPGEFSARAFFNGKMDLTEAEGIAATISAATQTELRAAASLRTGDLHRWATATADRLGNVLALLEAGIDFVDEEGIHFIELPALDAALAALAEEIRRQLSAAVRIDRLASPPTIVFIGKPNVGKSSLINALAGRDRSIVSPIAGTTRDMLGVEMHVGDDKQNNIRLVDVPGSEDPADELRTKMMAARDAALLDADLVVEVFAVPEEPDSEKDDQRRISILNKVDLAEELMPAPEAWRHVSAKAGVGIDALRETLTQLVTGRESTDANRLVLNHRHRMLLQAALGSLDRAQEVQRASGTYPELLAAELRNGLDELGQLTGTISPDEVLGRIFSQFCIGK